MRHCVTFSYFYSFSHLSIYLPLPSIISLYYFTMLSLDISSNNFLQKHNFDHFDLTFYKHFSCEILFSDFVYLFLDHITNASNKRCRVLNFVQNSRRAHVSISPRSGNDEDEPDEVESLSSSWMKYFIFKMRSTSFIPQSKIVHWSSSQTNDASLVESVC